MLSRRLILRAALLAPALTALGAPGPATAQPVAGKTQPNGIHFGVVRVGATAEASVRIFIGGGADDKAGADTTGLRTQLDPPAFVRVIDLSLGTQTYGQLGTHAFCDVSISLDTRQAGEKSGTLAVQVGEVKGSVPVSASILPADEKSTRVLVIESPFDRFSTDDATQFDVWLALVKSANLSADYWLTTPGRPALREKDLAQFDVILLAEEGLIHLSDKDVKLLHAFAEEGGRVVVCANAFFVGTVARANEILTPYGLRINDTEPRLPDNRFEITADTIVDDPLTRGVKRVVVHRPSPVGLLTNVSGKVLVPLPPYPEEGLLAAAQAGRGEVVALGTSLWWNWIGRAEAGDSDNALLLQNLMSQRRR